MKPCFRCGAGKRYKTSSYCQPCHNEYCKERNRRLKGIVLERECTACGVEFVASNGKQKKCSPRCGRPEPGPQRDTSRCPRCKVRKKTPGDGYCKPCRAEYYRERGLQKGSYRVFTCGACIVCGENFVSSNGNRLIGKYCSKRCEKKATRRASRKRNGRAEKFRGETRKFIPVLLADPCAYCGAPSAEIEHIVPRARGGANTWDNLTGACTACNARKSAKSLLTFLLGTISTA
jgi:5-methylcytosine-specific restriction endonuclease McrA